MLWDTVMYYSASLGTDAMTERMFPKPYERSITLLQHQKWLSGYVSCHLKYCRPKWHTSFKNKLLFWQFPLIVPQPWKLEKNSIIIKSTTNFPMSLRWSTHVVPKSPKGWLKMPIYHFVNKTDLIITLYCLFLINTMLGYSKAQMTIINCREKSS